MKHPPAPLLGPDGQAAALLVVATPPLGSELLAQDTLPFPKLVDPILLPWFSARPRGKSKAAEKDRMPGAGCPTNTPAKTARVSDQPLP